MNQSPEQNLVSPSLPPESNATTAAPSAPPPLPPRPAAVPASAPLPKKVIVLLCAAAAAVVVLLIILLVVLLLPSTKESPSSVVPAGEPPISAPSAQKEQVAAQSGKSRPPLTRQQAVQGVVDVLIEFEKRDPETDDMAGMVKLCGQHVDLVTKLLTISELPPIFRGNLEFLQKQLDARYRTMLRYRDRSIESLQNDDKFMRDFLTSMANVHGAIIVLCESAKEEGVYASELRERYDDFRDNLDDGEEEPVQRTFSSIPSESAPAAPSSLGRGVPAVDTNNLYYLYSTGQKNAPLSVGEEIDEDTGMIFRRDGRSLSGAATQWNSQITRTGRMLGGISLLEYQNQLFANPARVR